MGSTLQGKKLAPRGNDSFLYESRTASAARISFHLNTDLVLEIC